ncbi:HNH endonuclease [Halobiforma nitratireducens]|uniref:Uncharacterized protein n=1 Tax=Halobiforma nitratireducens JCM 10879 TaxID=1227454 RepID=M0M7A0_9EURY|nr:hypothetical protein [Halobiforma nitratireducens]EMA41692.1 hypothetical protein C446_05235 [Halobiforma nitratireducens JCM 10879]
MTSREWRGDRDAVFDRDDRTCRRCGTTDSDADGPGLRLYPVGDVPLEGTVHESALVTVCDACFASLGRTPTADSVRLEAAELFDLVREMTQRQGVTVSAAASFASLATSLPGEIDDDPETESNAETEAEYVQARREVLLAIDSVPSRLERLSAVETDHLEDATADGELAQALEALTDAAMGLQSELQELVALAESVAAGLDRCQGCLEPLDIDGNEDGRCPTCGLEHRDVDRWRGREADETDRRDELLFQRLYEEINATLQDASDTTEELTEGAAGVAELLGGTVPDSREGPDEDDTGRA